MSRIVLNDVPASERFPRVSGDEPSQSVGCQLGKVFSPRERG